MAYPLLAENTDAMEEVKVRKNREAKEMLFEELFSTYRDRVYYIARRYANNAEDALDLVQEIFIKAYCSLDTVKNAGNYGAWLYRIAVNHCIDKVRRKRLNELSYEEISKNGGGAVASSAVVPLEGVSGNELRAKVLDLVEELSPEHRAVLLLHCMENLPYKQIARIMRCSVGTVMSRLHYARKYLRRAMLASAII